MNIILNHENQTVLNMYIALVDNKVSVSAVSNAQLIEDEWCRSQVTNLAKIDEWYDNYFIRSNRPNTPDQLPYVIAIFKTRVLNLFDDHPHFTVNTIE